MRQEEQFSRTALLLGKNNIEKLAQKRVAVFGVGGVGGHAAEALARTGIGQLDLIDNDMVSLSNINRQLIATHRTLGMAKVEAMKERIEDINPDCSVVAHQCFYLPENASSFDFTQYDYIVDAVDTVTAKLELAMRAYACKVSIISSMGAGNKLDPTKFEVADIYQTSVCPLAKVMRRELKKRGIPALKVVYSKEEPLIPMETAEEAGTDGRRSIPGSTAFVPSVAGLIMAGEVIKDFIK